MMFGSWVNFSSKWNGGSVKKYKNCCSFEMCTIKITNDAENVVDMKNCH